MYSQLTINSTKDVAFHSFALLATRVKFFVSVHLAFSIIMCVVLTEVSVFKRSSPSYQETLDKGLLKILRVNSTLSDSFTIVRGFPKIVGLSASRIKLFIHPVAFFINDYNLDTFFLSNYPFSKCLHLRFILNSISFYCQIYVFLVPTNLARIKFQYNITYNEH